MPVNEVRTVTNRQEQMDREVRALKLTLQNITVESGIRETVIQGVTPPSAGGSGTTQSTLGAVTIWQNASGVTLNAGDVVIKAGNRTMTRTTSVSDMFVLGVVLDTVAVPNGANGHVRHLGYQATVNVEGAVAANDYLRTSATAGRAESGGASAAAGVFALALTAFAGPGAGTVAAYVFPVAMGAGGGGGGGTLDAAYDFGGAGAGRTINSTDGAVLIQNADADVNPNLEIGRAVADVTRAAQWFRTTGETNPMLEIRADGRLSWGPGGATVPDVELFWGAAGVLATNDHFRFATASRDIQDSGGTGRIRVATASPNVTLTGSVRVTSGNVGINTAPPAISFTGMYLQTLSGTLSAGGSHNAWQLAGSATYDTVNPGTYVFLNVGSFVTYTSGIAATSTFGLNFQPSVILAAGNSIGTFSVVRSAPAITGGGTVTTFAQFHAALSAFSGAVITNLYGFRLEAPAAAGTITTHHGLSIAAMTAGTSIYPIWVDAVADTDDTYGSAHRPNWQFGSLTRSFGTGDGVIGVANATTVPSTNPAAGGILYATGGAGTWRGSGGTVTTFGAAGPHCPECGFDFWTIAARNELWRAYLYVCGWCGTEYRRGPPTVLKMLTSEQRMEMLAA